MKHRYTPRSKLYSLVFQPRSQDVDAKRHEFILNLILAGLISASILAVLISVAALIDRQNFNGVQSIAFSILFLLLMIGCRLAVRRGYLRLASYVLVVLLTFVATQLVTTWGFMLAQALLMYVVVIVVAGILLGARAGLVWTAITVILLVGIAFDQTHGYITPDLGWRRQPPVLFDAIGYCIVFTIIGIVSWLSNREIDNSLNRARRSEAALKEERDNLEIKVTERTRELEELQLMRLMELERFAAFGRVSAALVHELSSPLMAATLGLQSLKSKTSASRLEQVNKSLVQIERQLESARMQLRGNSTVAVFSVTRELRRVFGVVQPIAQKRDVKLVFPSSSSIELRGDAVKFNQIASNLLMNAIESYPEKSPTDKRLVNLAVTEMKHGLKLVVHDWGSGIADEDMQRIFEPFYSKKPASEQHAGMGIGLGIVKRFVEQDFGGKLTVSSSARTGTRFVVTLKSVHTEEVGSD